MLADYIGFRDARNQIFEKDYWQLSILSVMLERELTTPKHFDLRSQRSRESAQVLGGGFA